MHCLLKLETCTLVQFKTFLFLIEFFFNFMTDFEYNEDKKNEIFETQTLIKQSIIWSSAYIV